MLESGFYWAETHLKPTPVYQRMIFYFFWNLSLYICLCQTFPSFSRRPTPFYTMPSFHVMFYGILSRYRVSSMILFLLFLFIYISFKGCIQSHLYKKSMEHSNEALFSWNPIFKSKLNSLTYKIRYQLVRNSKLVYTCQQVCIKKNLSHTVKLIQYKFITNFYIFTHAQPVLYGTNQHKFIYKLIPNEYTLLILQKKIWSFVLTDKRYQDRREMYLSKYSHIFRRLISIQSSI
jgi:hypothetical protein